MLAVVALSEISNPNPLIWMKVFGLNRLFRMSLVGVIPKFHLSHILKSCWNTVPVDRHFKAC